MAATILFCNNGSTTLAGSITNTATSANLAPGTGALFPNPTGGNYFVMTFTDAATGLLNEIVHVTAISSDTVTIVRAQEGTEAQSWNAGDNAQNRLTAGQMSAMVQFVEFSPTRVITTSGVFEMELTDAAVGLARTSSPAASNTTLPATTNDGQEYAIEDLVGNFNAYPVTVLAPSDYTIAGEGQVVLNVDRQCTYFRYYSDFGGFSVKF